MELFGEKMDIKYRETGPLTWLLNVLLVNIFSITKKDKYFVKRSKKASFDHVLLNSYNIFFNQIHYTNLLFYTYSFPRIVKMFCAYCI